ncbi:hypothetical protein GE061_019789 [Apolygus lucorum]|uniref:Uncharacterized protein n=1 Tax=Apolygus lucorum TaxID=248454 RepID=A0A6A4JYG6_APOLU|nr:hypothetical protein GE061_019789 [Apolygus lucorum]
MPPRSYSRERRRSETKLFNSVFYIPTLDTNNVNRRTDLGGGGAAQRLLFPAIPLLRTPRHLREQLPAPPTPAIVITLD